jgi:hypothetical protein
MATYYYQNSKGIISSELSASKIVDDIRENESGCIHFMDGTQLAISFSDGVPILELNKVPKLNSIIAVVVRNLGYALESQRIFTEVELKEIYKRALKMVS